MSYKTYLVYRIQTFSFDRNENSIYTKVFMICFVQIQVYTISFWMAHFGSPTPKRTTVMSNSKFVGMLHMGPFSRSKCKKSSTTRAFAFWVIFCDSKFCFGKSIHIKNIYFLISYDVGSGQYRDRQGRKRFVGTSKLKASQNFGLYISHI